MRTASDRWREQKPFLVLLRGGLLRGHIYDSLTTMLFGSLLGPPDVRFRSFLVVSVLR